MESREIVRATLNFSSPPRVARSFGGRESDFLWTDHTAATPATDWERTGEARWERRDEWGNLWARIDPTSKGEVSKGALDDLATVESLELPDFSQPPDYDSVRRARAEHRDKWLIGGMPGFTFNIARKLRRLDHYLTDLLIEPDAVAKLHDRIDRALEQMIVNYAAAGVDSVMFPEDWGTQAQLFIDPQLWRREFYPRFLHLCAVAHKAGVKVFMHSCGKIDSIVPSLIEAGIDVLQFDQPDLHGIDSLAEHQDRSPVTFWCPVDIQAILPTGDEKRIREKAREMLAKLWRGRGGFIAGYYADVRSLGVESSWQDWASDEFARSGSATAA